MNELLSIFNSLKEDFCALWTVKERGDTIEVSTPYVTTTDSFVTVFLTLRKGEYIVTDGGWISENLYGAELNFKEELFDKIFRYYISQYQIKETNHPSGRFFYKKTMKASQVPTMVFEFINFIVGICNSADIPLIEIKEKKESERFQKTASEFVRGVFATGTVKVDFQKSLDENYSFIRFSAVLERNNELTLINYVTGSTIEYFVNSISKTKLNFDISKDFTVSPYIKSKIALIDDLASGYAPNRVTPYINQLDNDGGVISLLWGNRNQYSISA